MSDPVTPAAPAVPNEGAAGAPVTPPAQSTPAAPATPAIPPPAQAPAAAAGTPATPATDPGKGAGALPPKGSEPVTPAKAEGTLPVAPEKYDLKLPKDSPVSAARLDQIKASAKERGLSNDQAQAELERENQTVSDFAKGQIENLKQVQESWKTTAQTDPEIGGEKFKENSELAFRVVERFATPALKQELEATQYGNHPELMRLFVRIGRAMAPDQLVLPGNGQPPQQYSRYEDLYDNPTSPKRQE